jgi:hypothetical protein
MTFTRTDQFIRIIHDDDRDVSFESDDESRFFLSVSETIAAGRHHLRRRDHLNEVRERIQALQRKVAAWSRSHAAAIKAAYLSFNQGQFMFLVVQRGIPLNEPLERELIELDIHLSQSLEVRPLAVEVMLLPECDEDCLNTFIPKDDRRPVPHAAS